MTLHVGSKLGPYEILSQLGAGGMGEVYRARDPKLDREVAIKVLPGHLTSDAVALSRFEAEAKAVAALSHPNILAIHDFGKADGVSYAVTELLEGETLRGKLDAGAVSQKQAVDWAQQIARGLSAAHGKGVVHRDLKPENVFVTNDGHVKLLDFGLAKRIEKGTGQTSAPTDIAHTEPGTVMGTMGYMSPEQVRGLPVDHRTDIFSLGAVLYEMLSGRKAFKRDTTSDTVAAIMRDEPPDLSESGRNIPIALDHIVKHCLEKDRENRFQAAKDVAFALSEASGPTTITSGVQAIPPARGRGRILIAAAIIAVLAAAGILLLRLSPRTGGGSAGVKRVAVLPFENLGSPEDDYFADGIADQIRGKLTSVPGLEVIARGSSTPYKKTNKTPQEIARELSANYLLTATVRWQKSGGANRVQVNPELVEIKTDGPPSAKWQQPFDAALTDVFQVQSEIASKVAESLGAALGSSAEKRISEKPTQNLAAYDAFLKGEATSNVLGVSDPPTVRKSLGYYEQAVALDPNFALGWARVSLASSLLYSNSLPEQRVAERARQAAERTVALAPGRPEAYHAVGNYQRLVLHDMSRARDEYAKGLRIAPSDPLLLGATSSAEQGAGLWSAAIEHAKQAERVDPRSVSAARRLGVLLFLTRRYSEARQALDKALALAPSNVNCIEYRTLTFIGEGDLEGARSALASASKNVDLTALVAYVSEYNDLVWVLDDQQKDLLLRLTPDAFDGDVAGWAMSLTQAYALRGDAANTRIRAEDARKAVEEQLRLAPDDDQRHAILGLALAYLGRKEDAIREARRAVELMPMSRDTASAAYNQHQLVRVYSLLGEPEKALDQLEPLLKIPAFLSPGWLKIDPNFDPLRTNPRFQKLVASAK
jgi:TolB-like protein/Flp pilus assembly protein TadD